MSVCACRIRFVVFSGGFFFFFLTALPTTSPTYSHSCRFGKSSSVASLGLTAHIVKL